MSAAPDPFDPAVLAKLSARDLKVLIWQQQWRNTARPKQLAPTGDWSEWGILAGRGFGKSLTGMNWLGIEALTDPEALPSAVIAPTLNDVRYTCFEGHTGLLNILPPECVKDYNKTNLIVTLDNGAVIRGFSAEEPERLRGPQFARVVGDEVAAWVQGQDTYDMMMFGLRLGPNPKFVWTTTPKPKELIRSLVKPKPGRIITTGSTYENRENLPKSFFDQLAQYEGTQLGRQELEGELIDAEEGGIIQRKWLKKWPANKPLPIFEYIVMSLDTAFTEKTIDRKSHDPDPTACQVWGVFWEDKRARALLLDAWAEHLGMPELIKTVKRERQAAYGDDKDRPMLKPLVGPGRMATSGRKPDLILIEDKGSGISLRQSLEAEGIGAHPYNPGHADKLQRLHMVSHIFAQGLVYIPESERKPGQYKTWAEPVVQQICAYRGPGSIKHDDHVDACTQSLRLLSDKGLLSTLAPSQARKEDPHADPLDKTAPRERKANPYAA